LKTIFAIMLATSGAAALSVSAAADGNGAHTFTSHVKSFTSSLQVPPLCQEPNAGTLTTTVNGVVHFTFNANGTVSFTSTVTGPFTFGPDDPRQPTFSGHYENWDGGHGTLTFDAKGNPLNGTTADHATINFTGVGSDGTHFSAHINEEALLVWTNGVLAVTVTAFQIAC
jgi:hypothetical protein